MEPSEHGDCLNAALGLERTWNRLLVRESLVRRYEREVLGPYGAASDAHPLHSDRGGKGGRDETDDG